ncbi:MAG: hypothetical protein M1834_000615 [Cirrosporium novae-zelandiae]|nr:MAG: hypothetical protein M1834_000615 [Cirrosporium novae-zelandiae]
MSTTATVTTIAEAEWGSSNKYGNIYGTTDIKSEDSIVGNFDSIPIINVGGIFSENIEDRKAVAAQLRDACTRVGFFYIENHGIPEELLDRVFQLGKEFFALPFEEKMETYINNTSHYRGFTPLYSAGKAGPDGKGNANEAFDWGHDSKLTDDPNDQFVDPYMRGENPWPRHPEDFESTLSEYYRQLRAFTRVMARNVALSLGLKEDYFEPQLTHPGCTGLIAHYPPQPAKSNIFGIDGHTDAEFLTILAPGDVRALEVLNRDGYWISAPPQKGCYIVNVGDQLQACTNGLYVSTMHRVLNYSGQERYSVPFFLGLNYEEVVKPIPELVKNGDPVKFSPLTAGQMYKQTMVGFHALADRNPEFLKYKKAKVIGADSAKAT